MSVVVPAMFISFCWGVQPIIHKYLLHTVSSETMMITSSLAYFVCVFIYFLIYKTKVIKEVKILHWKQLFWICLTTAGGRPESNTRTGLVTTLLQYTPPTRVFTVYVVFLTALLRLGDRFR